MKIALIGNMNNNNFALMRILRKEGLDAHLFLYTNEQFLPNEDSNNLSNWENFIHDLKISNGKPDILFFNKKELAHKLKDFDCLIGNGVAPYLLRKINRNLNIFMPYGEGIEHLNENTDSFKEIFFSKKVLKLPKNLWFKICSFIQFTSLDNCNVISTFNLHDFSLNTFKENGIYPELIPIFPLFDEKKYDANPLYLNMLKNLPKNSIKIFSHVAHFWKNLPYKNYMDGIGKRNNWLIEGLHQYYSQPFKNEVYVILTEYGPDIEETKKIIKKFGLEKYFLWIPKLRRTEIYSLIDLCDIGSSEFANMFWGSCGWEFINNGKIFFHQLSIQNRYSERKIRLPNFININDPKDIADYLLNFDKKKELKRGDENKKWYIKFKKQYISNLKNEIYNYKKNKKIRISFIIGSLNLGGTEKHLLSLINNLDRKIFNIDLFLLNEEGTLFNELNGFTRVVKPKQPIFTKFEHIINFFRVLYYINIFKPKIIHCFLPQSYIFGGLIGWILKHKNIIMSRRSLNNYQKKYKFIPITSIEKFLHSKIKYALGNSKAVINQLKEEGVTSNKLKLIYNGILTKNEKSKVNSKDYKGLKKTNTLIFSVIANLIPYKNHTMVIKAAEKLLKETNNFKILFVGSGSVNYSNSLKAKIEQSNLTNNIIFKKQSLEIDDYFKITDVGISSSDEEGFSNSIIEYLHFGKPVIATKVGGNLDVINNKNGFLIDKNNHDQLYKAMKYFLFNKHKIRQLSAQAIKDSKKYNFKKMIDQYTKLYTNICKS